MDFSKITRTIWGLLIFVGAVILRLEVPDLNVWIFGGLLAFGAWNISQEKVIEFLARGVKTVKDFRSSE